MSTNLSRGYNLIGTVYVDTLSAPHQGTECLKKIIQPDQLEMRSILIQNSYCAKGVERPT